MYNGTEIQAVITYNIQNIRVLRNYPIIWNIICKQLLPQTGCFRFYGYKDEKIWYNEISGFAGQCSNNYFLGLVLMGMSETSFLLLLLLLVKGYTVTRGRLPISASIKLTVFMCIYAVTYVSIFIYEAKVMIRYTTILNRFLFIVNKSIFAGF